MMKRNEGWKMVMRCSVS